MRFQGFIGPSYTLQSVNVDCQRCINLYPEIDEAGTGNAGEVASLVSTPGLTLLVTLPKSPVRGVYCDTFGRLWAVGGNVLYSISSSFVATAIASLFTSTGPVSFSDNGIEVVLVDGSAYGYFITSAGNFMVIYDTSFLGSTQVSFLDGYFIFNNPGTQQFYLSPLNAVTPFNGLDVGSAEAHPDYLVGHAVIQENLYLFSERHMEVWYNSGAASFPLARIQGAVIEIGCAAAFSIATIQMGVFWLGQDANGVGTVYRAQGLQPQRISTFAIENQIQRLGVSLSTARAWTYQQAGHYFYCLNLPGSDTTWCFDTATNLWHERSYLSRGSNERHLADCHAFAFNRNIVGDYSSGNIYSLSQSVFTDNTAAIRRERVSPHISKSLNRIFHSQFYLDIETGVGIDGTGQGTDPQVMLSWSNDFGHSWSNEHWVSAGQIGARRARAIFRRLGSARDRVYRVQITDPVKVTLLGAELELEAGSS